jgi:glutamate/tyrosine decarboxylase-like PLP-dependent enzyme
MHTIGKEALKLREQIMRYAAERMDLDPAPLDAPQTKAWLDENVPKTITENGLGGAAALEIFGELLAPATISTDHPNFLSFIPNAPSEAATFFDLVVSASSIYGGSWMEGSGAVYAENQVLEFLAQEVGLPEGAGGLFVQGGTLGNLSALVTAREAAKDKGITLARGQRWAAVCSSEAHSSLKAVAKVMDIELIKAPVDDAGKLTGDAVATAISNVLPSALPANSILP